mmetsp:Transcript_12995/g.38175  ORF Transcript_12995/g.38175 Transcript_12995/m.38175 type:complete len:182 (-) Transcript_12995:381-926(-)
MRRTAAIGVAMAVASSFLVPGVQIAATFDPSHLRLVNRVGNSLMVRGNAPLNHQGNFDPDMLIDAVRKRFLGSDMMNVGVNGDGKTVSAYRLVVVRLVSGIISDERIILEEERDFSWNNIQIVGDVRTDDKGEENDLRRETERESLPDDNAITTDSRAQHPSGEIIHRPIVGSYFAPPPLF